jgi:hypothetical protein
MAASFDLEIIENPPIELWDKPLALDPCSCGLCG